MQWSQILVLSSSWVQSIDYVPYHTLFILVWLTIQFSLSYSHYSTDSWFQNAKRSRIASKNRWGVSGKNLLGLWYKEQNQMPLWVPVIPGKFWLVYSWVWYKGDWYLENCSPKHSLIVPWSHGESPVWEAQGKPHCLPWSHLPRYDRVCFQGWSILASIPTVALLCIWDPELLLWQEPCSVSPRTPNCTLSVSTYGNYSLKRVMLVRLEIEGIMDGKESTKSCYGQDDGEYLRSLCISFLWLPKQIPQLGGLKQQQKLTSKPESLKLRS